MAEKLMVIPKDILFSFLSQKNYNINNNFLYFRNSREQAEILDFIMSNQIEGDRSVVEQDESLKQIIGYIIFRKKIKICCDKYFISYFLMRRNNQTENRLNDKYSMGVGGHIRFQEDIFQGILREINEEIGLKFNDNDLINLIEESNYNHRIIPIGMINDDSNAVGRVHFGINYLVDVNPALKLYIKEKDVMTGNYVPVNLLSKYFDTMETWTQIVYNNIEEINDLLI